MTRWIMTRWIITHGRSTYTFYTCYHAEQYARALSLNGTPHTLTVRP